MADDDQQWKIPPNVQELAAAGIDELPNRYVVRDHDRPTSAVTSDDPIPVVDLNRLSSGAADQAAKLRSALQNWGLFLVRKLRPSSVSPPVHSVSPSGYVHFCSEFLRAVGHGIEPALLGEMMAVTREFFKLPLEEKQKYTNLVGGKKEYQLEGYGGDMVLSETQVLDWCDRFYLIVEPESRRLHDLWPTQPPSFRDVLQRELAGGVLREVSKVVGLRDERYLADMLDEKAVTYVRLNLYPCCPRPDKGLGFKPHSDGNMLTVLLANVAGFQVLLDGEWYEVPVVPGALVVNLGETVEVVSNGFAQEPGSQGGDECGEEAGVGGGVLHVGPREGGGAGDGAGERG
ncbi:hypothetical protein ACQ4PT_021108 [Festuca glaucescens]